MKTKLLFSVGILLCLSSCYTIKPKYQSINDSGCETLITKPYFSVKRTVGYYVPSTIVAIGTAIAIAPDSIPNETTGKKEKAGWGVGGILGLSAGMLTYVVENQILKKANGNFDLKNSGGQVQKYLSKLSKRDANVRGKQLLAFNNQELILLNKNGKLISTDQVKRLKSISDEKITDFIIGNSLDESSEIKMSILNYFPKSKYASSIKNELTNNSNTITELIDYIFKYHLDSSSFESKAFGLVNSLRDINAFNSLYPGNTYMKQLEEKAIGYIKGFDDVNTYMKLFPQSDKRNEIEEQCLSYISGINEIKQYENFFGGSKFIFKSDNSTIIGKMVNGKLNGPGAIKTSDITEAGYFKNGLLNGNGVKVQSEGTFSGLFENDLLNGYGKASYSNGESYTGKFQNGIINGKGILKKPDGSIYDGNFKQGIINGHAVITLSDGTKLTGSFVDGSLNGKGQWEKPDGSWYDGAFKDGMENGYGTRREPNGLRYSGNWVNGLANGKFTIERWTMMGLFSDKWVAEYNNGKLVSQNQTKSDMTDMMNGNSSGSGQSSNSSSDTKSEHIIRIVVVHKGKCNNSANYYEFYTYYDDELLNPPTLLDKKSTISENNKGIWNTDCGGVLTETLGDFVGFEDAAKEYYKRRFKSYGMGRFVFKYN